MAKNTINECLSDVRNFFLPQQDRFERLLDQTQAQLQILKQNQQLLMGLDNNCTGEYNLSNATKSDKLSNECQGEEHIDNTSSVLSNSERDDVGITMTNVSNMECIQDCPAKYQRINAISSLDRVPDTGKKYQEQTKRKWNMVGGSQRLVRTLVYQKSKKQRTKRKPMGQKRRSPACLMKALKPMKWRKSPFLRRLRRRKQ